VFRVKLASQPQNHRINFHGVDVLGPMAQSNRNIVSSAGAQNQYVPRVRNQAIRKVAIRAPAIGSAQSREIAEETAGRGQLETDTRRDL
jgi:hypothetical protein